MPSRHAQFLWEDPFMPRGILDMEGALVVTVSIVNTGAYTRGPGQRAGYVCYLVRVMSQGLLDLSRF